MFAVRLFGVPTLLRDGVAVEMTCRKGWIVLAILATSGGRPVSRGRIAGELWPDHDEVHARRALATTLWRLSKAAPEPLVEAAGETLRVAQGVRCDLIEFRTLLAKADPDDPGAALEEAISLQAADLLPEEDSEWCNVERENLRALLVEALDQLLAIHSARCEYRRALATGQRLLQVEPYMEHAHRAVIRAFGALGERVAAARQFQRCAALLKRELGIAPMPETVAALLEATGAIAPPGPASAQGDTAGAALARLRRHLDGACHALDELSRV